MSGYLAIPPNIKRLFRKMTSQSMTAALPSPPIGTHLAPFPLRELVVEALTRGISLRLRLLGGSMWPFLASGTVAQIVPVAPWRVEVGDVVLCGTPQGFLAHRVMGRRNTPDGTALLITKGDALPFRDEPMPWEAVLGQVVDLEVRGLAAWRRAFLHGPGARLALAYSRLNPPLLLAARAAKRALRRLLRGHAP